MHCHMLIKVIDLYPRWIVQSWSSHTQICYSLFGVLFFREKPLAAVIRAVDSGVQINHLLRWFKMQHMHRFWFFSIPLPPQTMKVVVKEEFTPFFDTETSADERSEGSRSQRRRSEQKELLEAPFERTGHFKQLHRMCWRAVPRRVGTVWYCQHEKQPCFFRWNFHLVARQRWSFNSFFSYSVWIRQFAVWNGSCSGSRTWVEWNAWGN